MSLPSLSRTGRLAIAAVCLATPLVHPLTAHPPLRWPVPVNRATSPYAGHVTGIDVQNGRTYVIDSGLGLYLLDVSDPAAPTLVRTEETTPSDIKIAGHHLLALSGGTLRIYDISDPRNPVEGAKVSLPTEGGRLALSHWTAFVADRLGGLLAIDVSNAANPQLLGRLEITGFRLRDVEVVSNLVYTADAGIRVLDASDPAAPALVGCRGPNRSSHLGRGRPSRGRAVGGIRHHPCL